MNEGIMGFYDQIERMRSQPNFAEYLVRQRAAAEAKAREGREPPRRKRTDENVQEVLAILKAANGELADLSS